MIYYAPTAQVMGQDSASTVSPTSASAQAYKSMFSNMSQDAVIDRVLDDITKTYTAVQLAYKGGQNLLTSEIAGKISHIVEVSNTAIAVMLDMYADVDFTSVYPVKWEKIVSKQQQIINWLKVMSAWNLSIADAWNVVREKQTAAILANDLDSPFVGQGMKMMIISMAYGQGVNNPKYEAVREKYFSSGELKAQTEEQKIYSPEERKQFISTEMKSLMTTPEKTDNRGLITAAIAGIVAFFALR